MDRLPGFFISFVGGKSFFCAFKGNGGRRVTRAASRLRCRTTGSPAGAIARFHARAGVGCSDTFVFQTFGVGKESNDGFSTFADIEPYVLAVFIVKLEICKRSDVVQMRRNANRRRGVAALRTRF